jgi:hypothetical protein
MVLNRLFGPRVNGITMWVTAAKRYLKYLGSEDAIPWGQPNSRWFDFLALPRTSPNIGRLLVFHSFYGKIACELVRVQPNFSVGNDVGYDERKCGE